MTVIYVTARTFETQIAAKEQLDLRRQTTDESLHYLKYWPGLDDDGHMYQSPFLFSAVLDHHRNLVKVGNYFQDEVQFYTNIIDVIFGWLMREVSVLGEDDLWRWLLSYTYLMGSINYIGAEQSLCSVFFSIICFSHRETFYYANYSFSGEAVFRLYRQSYPVERGGGWRIASHSKFFPNLHGCRKEIFADMDYHGMSIDPSLCDYSRKNETRFHDLEILTLHEHQRLKTEILSVLQAQADNSSLHFFISGIVLGVIASYVTILHILRCSLIKCVQSRSTVKWEPKNNLTEGETQRGEDVLMETKMINYDEYTQVNTMNTHTENHNRHKPHSIQFKVATV